jgi:hypothetical protein
LSPGDRVREGREGRQRTQRAGTRVGGADYPPKDKAADKGAAEGSSRARRSRPRGRSRRTGGDGRPGQR